MDEIFDFVVRSDKNLKNTACNDVLNVSYLSVAAILTGINKPDHFQYFKLLANEINKQKIVRTVFLPARDCPNIRSAIETLVSSILNDGRKHNYHDDDNEVVNFKIDITSYLPIISFFFLFLIIIL